MMLSMVLNVACAVITFLNVLVADSGSLRLAWGSAFCGWLVATLRTAQAMDK